MIDEANEESKSSLKLATINLSQSFIPENFTSINGSAFELNNSYLKTYPNKFSNSFVVKKRCNGWYVKDITTDHVTKPHDSITHRAVTTLTNVSSTRRNTSQVSLLIVVALLGAFLMLVIKDSRQNPCFIYTNCWRKSYRRNPCAKCNYAKD